ncbi:hypothetical protein A2U01_0027085 [Trifolium medium]|uniref:Uncharacterized protein n=1 Tax=Trifolium medium TaxID=97028 RepID=A0A392P3H8_9FABA|nr:hypothetical protein [Trifolium medium]
MSSSRDKWSVRWDLKRQTFRLLLPRVRAIEKASLWPRGPLDLINGGDAMRRAAS